MIGLTDENILANTIQSIKDLIYGGLTQRNMKSIRTYFAVNAMDSLDSDYPMYVPFNIPANTVKVVTVYVSFTILPFRAYSKSAASSEQITTSSGGGSTTSSGGGATTSSGGSTSPVSSVPREQAVPVTGDPEAALTMLLLGLQRHTHTVSIPSHYHYVYAHTHYVYPHTHTIPPHAHEINFGIYEVDKHPSITLYVSRDGGGTYPYRIGTYSSSQDFIEITQYVDTPGNKMLKFEATDLGRVSTQIEIKVDISK
jgi:hypothetical protein